MLLPFAILSLAVHSHASPTLFRRTVSALDQAAFAEAQQRDATATRAFSSVPITTSSGQCLAVDELSGDFRANLTPIKVAACDGSTGQQWDVITNGKHNNVAGSMLVVNTLTQACLNFDPRRAAGNTVIMFSCGGRADGSQLHFPLFPFNGTAGPLTLSPENAAGTCLFVTSGNVLDQAPCSASDATQTFTLGASSGNSGTGTGNAQTLTALAASLPTNSVSPVAVSSSSALTTAAPQSTAITGTATTPGAVSRAGGVLDPSAAAEANPVDGTAVKAFSSVALKDASGNCLFVDPTAGDFRENLIPITSKPCDGSQNQAWDIITSGKHNNVANSALIVSSLTQGCLNFDPRRAAGDNVIMFSCGGRADGDGLVTNSQLFPFTAGQANILLAPENANNATCLVVNAAGKLDSTACSADVAGQSFDIV
ncbi:Ricin-type beta-trefoil lectin domain-containing protein [Rutstroemia sp. NJR-2017a BVV2]|nr:Ricin-type beta-trefoil lectin domain-containing protein [Rutstroemia sp. NJR-2017a BVV2]